MWEPRPYHEHQKRYESAGRDPRSGLQTELRCGQVHGGWEYDEETETCDQYVEQHSHCWTELPRSGMCAPAEADAPGWETGGGRVSSPGAWWAAAGSRGSPARPTGSEHVPQRVACPGRSQLSDDPCGAVRSIVVFAGWVVDPVPPGASLPAFEALQLSFELRVVGELEH